ncbi:MAG: hypothetical protein EBR59_02325 [Methylococcaceae bacterium]|nr:hypothetical protein [Methylococcaceae bacterium]
MNDQHKKNRLTIVVIFAMAIIPFSIAWYLAGNPNGLKLGTNNGELIAPVVTTDLPDFVVVMPQQPNEPVLSQIWQEDARLLKIKLSPSLLEKVQQVQAYQEASLLIMDPLGNLMMRYAAGYDPYKVRNDLSKLLRISQIG